MFDRPPTTIALILVLGTSGAPSTGRAQAGRTGARAEAVTKRRPEKGGGQA
jgi:hypothetical protein